MYETLALLAVFVLVYSAVAGAVERSWISGPIIFTLFGLMWMTLSNRYTKKRVKRWVGSSRTQKIRSVGLRGRQYSETRFGGFLFSHFGVGLRFNNWY